MQIAGLIIALVGILIGGLLFMGAVSNWFSGPKAEIDAEYYCEEDCGEETFMELTKDGYKELTNAKKSFVVFIDKDGCTTADKMRGFLDDYIKNNKMKIYRMDYDDMKETSMHELVKRYPSVVIVVKGKVFKFLRDDNNEDVDAFESKEAFESWMGKYL